jgi:hypothetical protein
MPLTVFVLELELVLVLVLVLESSCPTLRIERLPSLATEWLT